VADKTKAIARQPQPAIAPQPQPRPLAKAAAPTVEPPAPKDMTLSYSGKRALRLILEEDVNLKITGSNDGDLNGLIISQDNKGGHVVNYVNVEKGHICGGAPKDSVAQLLMYDAGRNTYFALTMGE
jgi:hypothetical protein